MNDATNLQARVDRALRAVAQAPAPEGMEARVVSRLRERQREMAERGASRYAGLARVAAGALAAGALVMALVVMRPHAPKETVAVSQPSKGAPSERPMTAVHLASAKASPLRRRRQAADVRTATPEAYADLRNPPPLPLTEQEKLLLELARSPRLLPQLGSIAHSEAVSDHGVGQNTIFELDHQQLQPIPNMPLGGTQ